MYKRGTCWEGYVQKGMKKKGNKMVPNCVPEEFVKEEKSITSQFDNDPIAKLRSRELDLRAQENQRKEREGRERMDLDKMRAMMAQENQDEKLEQNEELAKLRADTSIEKTILGKTLPSSDQMVPNVQILRKGN